MLGSSVNTFMNKMLCLPLLDIAVLLAGLENASRTKGRPGAQVWWSLCRGCSELPTDLQHTATVPSEQAIYRSVGAQQEFKIKRCYFRVHTQS